MHIINKSILFAIINKSILFAVVIFILCQKNTSKINFKHFNTYMLRDLNPKTVKMNTTFCDIFKFILSTGITVDHTEMPSNLNEKSL